MNCFICNVVIDEKTVDAEILADPENCVVCEDCHAKILLADATPKSRRVH